MAWARLIAWCSGALGAVLLARLLARLLAARPDNPVVALLYRLSNPLILPLARLDAGQPRFGASLEFSTLLLLLLLTLLGYVAWRIARTYRV